METSKSTMFPGMNIVKMKSMKFHTQGSEYLPPQREKTDSLPAKMRSI